ncbi:hypothetical protein [Micromonospora sp. NPDC047074]|uniref:hypothetical protein n=1 Tax=Micromonospora sp. NPDC047074 TaxID=3154339 RepID=UPI0033D1CA0E
MARKQRAVPGWRGSSAQSGTYLTAPDPTALFGAGATLLREPDDALDWWILADPEGDEVRAFAPRPSQ